MKEGWGMEGTVLLVTKNGMGSAEEDLQQSLFGTYLRLLVDGRLIPSAICFYTDGVKLLCDGSPVLEPLAAIEQAGSRLIACSTCLNYFGLTDQLRVGIAGGMPDIIEAQATSDKVISL
jgi:hypothetical protein